MSNVRKTMFLQAKASSLTIFLGVLPSVDINGQRHVVPNDGIHDSCSLLYSPNKAYDILPTILKVNLEKRGGIQNSPGYRHHDMVNVTSVHVENWCCVHSA